jgi:uridine kinase
MDLELLNQQLNELLAGKEVEIPKYDFASGSRVFVGNKLHLEEKDILIMEGIHALNPEMTSAVDNSRIFRLYASALTSLNIDENVNLSTSDNRLLRRMVRDNRVRNTTPEDTLLRWNSVRRGETKNIFPYQESADVMVNSSMIYELPVLKIFAAPLLFQIKPTDPEYQEAKRLLKFLDYILPISPELIPQNSIIREFIGGSCLDVG